MEVKRDRQGLHHEDGLRVGIAYYGAGNIGALAQALLGLGSQVSLLRTREDIWAVDAVVLPGVGAMASAMQGLAETGLDVGIRAWAEAGKPLLGVCLGMQMLVGDSEEGGRGLGLIPGRTRRLPAGRIPNLGWCEVRPRPGAGLFRTWPGPSYGYFAHSFAVSDTDPAVIAATAVLGEMPGRGPAGSSTQPSPPVRFVAALERGNLTGVQFHPERSGDAGREVLRAFLTRCQEVRDRKGAHAS